MKIRTLATATFLIAISNLALMASPNDEEDRHRKTSSGTGPAVIAREIALPTDGDSQSALRSVGRTQSTINSRGTLVAQTYRDWQSNGSIGRMVAINPPSSSVPGIQFAYTIKRNGTQPSHPYNWGFNVYNASTGSFEFLGGKCIVQDNSPTSMESGVYPRIVVGLDGRAVIAGHDWIDYQNYTANPDVHVSVDIDPMIGEFGGVVDGSRMDVTVNRQGNFDPSSNSLWPVIDLSESGPDSILYVAVTEQIFGDFGAAMKVYRKTGKTPYNPDATWSLVFLDSSAFVTHDVACDRTSTKVAVVWTKPTPYDRNHSGVAVADVWYAESPSGLSGTWARTNVTNYSGEGYRAWVEVCALYDTSGKLHVLWNGSKTNGSVFGGRPCRLFHWTQLDPARITTVYRAEWDSTQTNCHGGQNVLNVGRISMGECDGRLYAVFSGFNDPAFGTIDDCCMSANKYLAANGEVYMTVSSNLAGASWDAPRNLSNSYTPGCDTGTCADDRFASVSRTGMDEALYPGTKLWPADVTYDPTQSYYGSKYLHLFYETDRYPGSPLISPYTGPNTLNDMRWIRLACVLPISAADLAVTPAQITPPEYTKPGVQKNIALLLENTGNVTLMITSVDVHEDSTRPLGLPPGWLGITGLNGSSNIATGSSLSATLQLNRSGAIVGSPRQLFGRIVFNFGPPVKSLTLPVQFIVADTVVYTVWDTISTNCLDLAVGTDGNMGHRGGDGIQLSDSGRVNMDYFGAADCDTGANSRGNSGVYLYDGSPIIIRKLGPSTYRGSWSTWSEGFDTEHGFRPVTGVGYAPHGSFSTATYDAFNSGTFVTVDSLVQLECTWWSPKHPDSCNFIVQRTRIFSANIASAVTGLQIGEMIDFNIPTDSSSTNNTSGFDAVRRMVWTRGFNSQDTVLDCTDNSRRYGGMALLRWFMKNRTCFDSIYGCANFPNDQYVSDGPIVDSLSRMMHMPGYITEPRVTDFSMLLTIKDGSNGYTLPAYDTLTIFTAISSVRTAASSAAGLDSLKKAMDKALKFMKTSIGVCSSCCIGMRGNVNMIGGTDLNDLMLLLQYLTSPVGSVSLPCNDAANVDARGIIDGSDVTFLVAFLTGTGAVLPYCP